MEPSIVSPTTWSIRAGGGFDTYRILAKRIVRGTASVVASTAISDGTGKARVGERRNESLRRPDHEKSQYATAEDS